MYVDGYNLYFGRLKKSAYKWLDLRAFASRVLTEVSQEPNGETAPFRFVNPAVKYFTAPILEPFAKSDDSRSCQLHYHDALIGHLADDFEMITGYYEARPARAHRWEHGRAARECGQVEVWKLEEKQSDVALALHAYSDAIRNDVDQIVVITNDSDFEPAMQMIRRHTPTVIGLIAPIRPGTGNANADLEKHVHWVRRNIGDDEIARSQLPSIVRRHNRVVHKPLSWYPRPDLLIPIFNEAKRVRGSAGAAHKWLNQPCSHLGNRIPIAMCEQEDSAGELRSYIALYALEFGV